MSQASMQRDASLNSRGALFMIAAMAFFAVEDACLKAVAASLPVSQILILFGTVGVLVFSGLALRAKERPLAANALSPLILARSLSDTMGRLFYMLAIALTPLSTASAILQATPLVVIGCAGLFGERVSARRWLSVFAGFGGVVCVLRPGAEGFSILSLLAVIAMLGFAGRDLATRAAPLHMSHRQLGVLGFSVLVISGLIAAPFAGPMVIPEVKTILILLLGSASGIVAYSALTTAMRTGQIAAVTPFRYTRLVFAIVAGFVVFQERPDLWTVVGSIIIVGSGIFALSERKKVIQQI
ncbi:DMT family transporter [Aliirhizobium cellulosilyticum]|uniref:Drug/metabolite transporter (DMT)-like permease n=1 Tax=Aliirhizobium cellulosilyticum TaxID=393664 RepID=A0A7W6UZD6_9HYPH|nr:DMT family transporter [Rhizobium cellulosilyticum]MBB4349308.1 drug/metabolite transporter (DMT)-like permease [Rhizobium cellulosilyticum]MBB4412470.1 drug/metabolite transporter (DMT)-like permease [Rhizobium cellulosilyticum]MBB4447102.1 drug/metabolite transporter (DMT)-like permease [Rhizobium cellulosilyticum]